MIPLKLEITNFLSYRQTAVLNFQAIHTACISGQNGAGKSSVLDAITWALFGQSRSKSDDDIVNRLAVREGKRAEVQYTFNLEGTIYRVIRRKRSGKRLVLELQLQVNEAEWKSLSRSKLRETQTAVEELLRMNYDTFTNASFLLQGQADEFTTKTASKRKEILADLLGVSLWNQYKDAATEKRKQTEGQLQLIEGQMGEIGKELEEEDTRRAHLDQTEAELATLKTQLFAKEQQLTEMRKAETAVKQQKQTVQTLQTNLTREQKNLTEREQTLNARQKERDSYQAILDQATTIQADYTAFQEAEKAVQTWQTLANKVNQLREAQRPLELTITQARTQLEGRLDELTRRGQAVTTARTERTSQIETITQATAQQTTLTEQLQTITQQETELQTARAHWQKQEGERDLYRKERDGLMRQQQRINKLTKEQTEQERELNLSQTLLAQLSQQLSQAQTQQATLRTLETEKTALDNQQPLLKETMEAMKERLDKLTSEQTGICPLCGQTLTQDHKTAVIDDLQTEGKTKGDLYRANKKRLTQLEQEINGLTTAVAQHASLQTQQQTAQTRQANAHARLSELTQNLDAWNQEGKPRLVQLDQLLQDEAQLQQAREAIKQLEQAITPKAKLTQQREQTAQTLAHAKARLAEIDRLISAWEQDGEAELTAVQTQLTNQAYAQAEQTQLTELTQQIQAIGYDNTAHQQAQAQQDSLKQAPEQYQAWQQAQAAVAPLDTTLQDLQSQISQQQERITDLTTQVETAQTQLATLQENMGDLRALEAEVADLREAEIEQNRQVAVAKQRLDVLDALRDRTKELRAEQNRLKLRVQRLLLLEKACGRDGVQALLIEQALPDIEDRANELLDKLTGGRMRVFFETQKQLKSRKAKVETLDIRIVDEVGERPYENFSGGEQFRVNFAIRLALSQLLTKRAGARLQTLVIDEGFGSQDPNGRQRLIEAIHTIQDDFARILVITHIDELRDAFPTRIEVSKTPSGSQITVV